jgi:hypothetical protein
VALSIEGVFRLIDVRLPPAFSMNWAPRDTPHPLSPCVGGGEKARAREEEERSPDDADFPPLLCSSRQTLLLAALPSGGVR